jgi:GTP cyclohydrolase FolE2
MDIDQLKDISDRSYRIAINKKNALEKARSSMLLAYSGHLFQADAQTINLVQVLKNKQQKFVVLDSNDNPMMIEDADDFLDKLIEKQQEALNTYHQSYNDSVTKG